MIDILEFIGIIYAFMVITFLFYLALMNLKRNKDKISRPMWIAVFPVYVGGIIANIVLMNFVVGTLFFLEIPRELVFTDRVKRHNYDSDGWRNDVANWFCANVLDPYDPDPMGHC